MNDIVKFMDCIFFQICSPYNLSTALFAETESNKYSSVVVVIKTSSSVERFENLKGQKACFAEFSGIGKLKMFHTQADY